MNRDYDYIPVMIGFVGFCALSFILFATTVETVPILTLTLEAVQYFIN